MARLRKSKGRSESGAPRSATDAATLTVAVAAFMAVLGGCSSPAPSVAPDTERPAARVIDAGGLVIAHSFEFKVVDAAGFEGLALDEGVAIVSPDPRWDVRVGWSALPCQTAPVVTLGDEEGELVVAIDRGPEVVTDGSGCESMEARHYVELDLAGDADRIAVRLAGE